MSTCYKPPSKYIWEIFEGMNTHETVVQRRWELLEVKPDVECARRRVVDLETELREALQNMVALHLEVLL